MPGKFMRETILTIDIPRTITAVYRPSSDPIEAPVVTDISTGAYLKVVDALNNPGSDAVISIKQAPEHFESAPLFKDYDIRDLCPFHYEPQDRFVEARIIGRSDSTFEADFSLPGPVEELVHQRLLARNVTFRWYLKAEPNGSNDFYEVNMSTVKLYLPDGSISLK